MSNKILLKKIILELFLKAGPIFIIYASNTITFNVKRMWIANDGTDALEAHIIARTIAELLTLPVPLLMAQTPIKVAELFGIIKAKRNISALEVDADEDEALNAQDIDEEGLQQKIGDVIRQGYVLSIAASIPVAAILIATRNPWVYTFDASEKVSTLAAQYLLAYSTVVTTDYVNTMTEGILSAIDQEKWILLLRVLSSAADIGLAFWLIPSYSVNGDAYANLTRNVVGICATGLLLTFYPPLSKYNVLSIRWGEFKNMRAILGESWPYSLYQLAQSGMSYILSIFMKRLGNGRLTAYQVPNALFSMATSVNTSISLSANRLVAQYFGSNDFSLMPKVSNISLASNAIIYTISAAGINLLQYQLASLFLNQEELANSEEMLRYSFIILTVVNFFQMLFDNGNQLLAATEDTIFSSLVWLISSIALTLPLSAIVSYLTNFDIYGIEFAIGIGAFGSCAATIPYWYKRSGNIIETENNSPSSNQKLVNLLSKISFFSCKNKNVKNNYLESNDDAQKKSLMVETEEMDYDSISNKNPFPGNVL